jgi:hypothetical protein
MYQHDVGFTLSTPGGNVQKNNLYSGNQHSGFSDTISAGTVTVPDFSVDVSAMEGLVISCDRDVVLTFNDDGTPDATVNLLAGKPLVWNNDSYFTNPLGSVDITSFKYVLAAGDDATLLIDVVFE